jgi:cyclic pyranopterin phosphate synthase
MVSTPLPSGARQCHYWGMVEEGAALVDARGRVVDDLRISVTDRCNFRCVYCMPAEGLKWLPRDEVLSFEEITRVAGLFVAAGTRTVRLTGGEPLVRRDLPTLVRMLAALHPDVDISLTTNGVLLRRDARALADAGLRRVNVSLDSLRADRFERLARRDALATVLDGIEAAREAGLEPIKVNVVVMRGINDDEVVEFGRLARTTGIRVRFIEYMPLDADGTWGMDLVVAGDELLDAAETEFKLTPVSSGHDPATRWRFADGSPGELGFINSVTEPFCERCNRVRLTADGQLRTCLFSVRETDLRAPLRAGADDAELDRIVRDAIWRKEPGHRIGKPDFIRPERSMSQIGG